RRQREAVAVHRETRNADAVATALGALGAAVRRTGSLFPSIKEACRAGATVGEISDAFRAVAGEHRPA
nr:methylmalonyl-CoA mutase [Gemmatimonadota bacterium]